MIAWGIVTILLLLWSILGTAKVFHACRRASSPKLICAPSDSYPKLPFWVIVILSGPFMWIVAVVSFVLCWRDERRKKCD